MIKFKEPSSERTMVGEFLKHSARMMPDDSDYHMIRQKPTSHHHLHEDSISLRAPKPPPSYMNTNQESYDYLASHNNFDERMTERSNKYNYK